MNAYTLGRLAALEKLGAGFPAKLLNQLRADGADISGILRGASPEEVEAIYQYVRPRPGGTPADLWINNPSFAKKLHEAASDVRLPSEARVHAAGPRPQGPQASGGGPGAYAGGSASVREARNNVSYAESKMRGGGATSLERGLGLGLMSSAIFGNPIMTRIGLGRRARPWEDPYTTGELIGIPGAIGGAATGAMLGSGISKLTRNPRYTIPGALVGAIAGNLGGGYVGGRLNR